MAREESLRKGRLTKGHQRARQVSVVPKTFRRMEWIQMQMLAVQEVAVMAQVVAQVVVQMVVVP